jgi:tRNA (cytidine/uridine-2'-O-)-methyltransferase
MLEVILHQPEIPPNTGNIIRLCANTGAGLSLIRPLGFALDDKRMRRAGLDYHEFARVRVFNDLSQCLLALNPRRLLALSTRGGHSAFAHRFEVGDALLFGSETRGLPDEVLGSIPESQRLRIPMRDGVRSLNLANAVAVMVYEAWRQLDFQALDSDGST